MQVQKTVKIPVHYATTRAKLDKLDKITARITYCIQLISNLIDDETMLYRPTIRKLVKNHNIASKTGLSAGFVDQCIDKVIWSWKSYKRLHKDWERKIEYAKKRGNEKYLKKLLKREPTPPNFNKKTPCRIDYRTGKIEWNRDSKLTSLWMHLSTLEKGNTMDVPLNPSKYHLDQLEDAEIDDFEIVKRNGKYYAHVSITKEIDEKPISSIGGIDQGLNRSIATVLLSESVPYEGLILDAAKQELLDKYDSIVAELQQAEKWDKLRELRNKRRNVSVYHDWCLANKVAEFTEGSLIAIGNSRFRQTQYRGNGMPKLRKRIGKWSYSRQKQFIALKRAERGYPTVLIDERNSSRRCHICGSMLTRRPEQFYILCYSCGAKLDADLNAAHNIALRCRDDWLKVGMNMGGIHASP